jgi:hypothetical protein
MRGNRSPGGNYDGFHVKKRGSSGKQVPQCYNHHSVVHQIAFARRLAYFFCLSKRSMEKKTPDDTGPADPPVLLCYIKWGTPNMRVPFSGMGFPEEEN